MTAAALPEDGELRLGPVELPPAAGSSRTVMWIGSVLRSWEDRFGARLLNVGPGAEIRLLVERPPRTRGTAEKIAAEHSVFCTECAGRGLRDIDQIADALVGAPFWTFWWD